MAFLSILQREGKLDVHSASIPGCVTHLLGLFYWNSNCFVVVVVVVGVSIVIVLEVPSKRACLTIVKS